MAELSNPKYEAFCQEYMKDLNGAQAAIRAGYSENAANVKGAQLLAIVSIQERIKELKDERQSRTQITADMVIQELAKIGFHNVQDFVNGGNSILELKHIERDKVAAVSSVKTTIKADGDIVSEIKFHDKVSALEKLGRHLGAFEADNKQKTDITVKRIGFESDI